MSFLAFIKDTILYFHTKFGMKKRVIYRGDSKPYLTRYYLFRKPFKWLPSLYLHCFHASDEDPEPHSHPWRRSLSYILVGSYQEAYVDENKIIQIRTLGPNNFNYIPANKFHRVDLETKEVWTLFLSGSKTQDWWFWNPDNNEYVHWKEHVKRKELQHSR